MQPASCALSHAKGIVVTDAQDVADELIAAEREHKAIAQFSDNDPDFDLDTAYRAQRAFVQSKLDAGERFVGYKLGLTSRNKQQAMGVDAPLYGRVTSGYAMRLRGARAVGSFHSSQSGVRDRVPTRARHRAACDGVFRAGRY